MAKESSFDVVSTVDMQEIDNAYQQAKKELTQRYDLKGSGAELSLDKQKKTITVAAPADFVARQVIDIMGSKLIKRGIDLAAIKEIKEVKRARLTEYKNYRPNSEYHEGRGVWSVKCDIALPCATQNECWRTTPASWWPTAASPWPRAP